MHRDAGEEEEADVARPENEAVAQEQRYGK
jgi:hypothetical protein